MPTSPDTLHLLSAAGLLPEGASAATKDRLSSLSAVEVQALLATRARVDQSQAVGQHGFLMI